MSDTNPLSPRISPSAEQLARAQSIFSELFPSDFAPVIEFKPMDLGRIDGDRDLVAVITLPNHLSEVASDHVSEILMQALEMTTHNPHAPDTYNPREIVFFRGMQLLPRVINLKEQKFQFDSLKRSLASVFDEERGHRIEGNEGGAFLC